jgi:hypothetical protein
LTPLLLQFAFKLLPLPFELIAVHYILLIHSYIGILISAYRRDIGSPAWRYGFGVALWLQCPLQSGWVHLHWPVGGSAFRHWSLQNSLPAGA